MTQLINNDAPMPGFHNLFRSERLLYKALQENEETKASLFDGIVTDPVTSGLAFGRILKPNSRATSDELLKEVIKNSVLAVGLTLPVAASADSTEQDAPAPKETIIGFLTLNNRPPYPRCVGVGLSIAAPYQDKGYGREAMNWALDWAFRWGDVHRVSIEAFAYNPRAVGLYRSLGFVDEGVMRKAVYMDRRWRDLVLLGMLEEDWKAVRGIE